MNLNFFTEEEISIKEIKNCVNLHIAYEKDLVNRLTQNNIETTKFIQELDRWQRETYNILINTAIDTKILPSFNKISIIFIKNSLQMKISYSQNRFINQYLPPLQKEEVNKTLQQIIHCMAMEIILKIKYISPFFQFSANNQPQKYELANNKEPTTKTMAYISLSIIALAFFNMPYGYYTFLRLFVCIASIYYIFNTPKDKSAFLFPWLICAIIYNPLIPLELKKDEWLLVNIGTIFYIFFWLWNHATQKEKEFIQNEGAVWIAIIITIFLIALLG